jgi:hypothetical protein
VVGVRLGDEVIVLGAPEVLGPGDQADEIARRQEARERVLVVGRAAELPAAPSDDEVPEAPAFMPLGLVALQERMRPDARELVAYLRREGVELKVMSAMRRGPSRPWPARPGSSTPRPWPAPTCRAIPSPWPRRRAGTPSSRASRRSRSATS